MSSQPPSEPPTAPETSESIPETPSFLSLQIPLSPEKPLSIFFTHLQNLINGSKNKNTIILRKICEVVYDIYKESLKMEEEVENVSKTTKHLLSEFSLILSEVKEDKEKLREVCEQRKELMEKLRESNEDGVVVAQENSILKETVARLKEINELLIEKNDVNEKRLNNMEIASVGAESFERISKEYDRLLQSNSEIREELYKVYGQADIIQKISEPMQIIDRAFKKTPELKDRIWESANENEEDSSLNLPLRGMKKEFYEFDFEKIINQIREENNKVEA